METEQDGSYLFREVEIEKLKGASVEFIYNGMCYQSIPVNAEAENGSKATEGKERQTFNNKFAVITHNLATSTDNESTELTYDKEEGSPVSKLNYEGGVAGYDGQRYPVAYRIDEEDKNKEILHKYEITAETKRANPDLLLGQTVCPNIETIYGSKNAEPVEEIKNINLGIKEREQPDIGIAKDLHNVKVEVNGKSHVYEYAQRFHNKEFTSNFLEGKTFYRKEENGEYVEDSNGDYIKYQSEYSDKEEYIPKSQLLFNVGVRYGMKQMSSGDENTYQNMTYRRAIYKADCVSDIPIDRHLQVYVTYKIKANIAGGNLQARINEIVDYYDTNYIREEVKVGTKLNNYDPVEEGATIVENEDYNNQYRKLVIKPENMQIGGQTDLADDNGCVYVQFKLNRQAVVEILQGRRSIRKCSRSYIIFYF